MMQKINNDVLVKSLPSQGGALDPGGLEKHGPVDKTAWRARSTCSESVALSTKRVWERFAARMWPPELDFWSPGRSQGRF